MEAKPHPVIEFFEFATSRRRALDVLPKEAVIYGGGTAIAAPPDGRWILFGVFGKDAPAGTGGN